MKELFNDILKIEDVEGVMLFSFEGELIVKEFLSPLVDESENMDSLGLFINSLKGIRDADLVFEKARLYVRKTSSGYVMILMGVFAPIAMVRLNCDILLPSLKKTATTKGWRNLFKKKDIVTRDLAVPEKYATPLLNKTLKAFNRINVSPRWNLSKKNSI